MVITVFISSKYLPIEFHLIDLIRQFAWLRFIAVYFSFPIFNVSCRCIISASKYVLCTAKVLILSNSGHLGVLLIIVIIITLTDYDLLRQAFDAVELCLKVSS